MSKALNKTQIEHLNSRLNDAIRSAAEKYGKSLPQPVFLKSEEKAAIIKKNRTDEFSLCLDDNGDVPYYTAAMLTFHADTKARALSDLNVKKTEKFAVPLHAEKQRIMDKAIMGGADEALAAMEAFIAKL